MAREISGRPARCVANRFTDWAASAPDGVPDCPIAYVAGKALNAAARSFRDTGFGAQWAGQAAPLHRELPACALLELLWKMARNVA